MWIPVSEPTPKVNELLKFMKFKIVFPIKTFHSKISTSESMFKSLLILKHFIPKNFKPLLLTPKTFASNP